MLKLSFARNQNHKKESSKRVLIDGNALKGNILCSKIYFPGETVEETFLNLISYAEEAGHLEGEYIRALLIRKLQPHGIKIQNGKQIVAKESFSQKNYSNHLAHPPNNDYRASSSDFNMRGLSQSFVMNNSLNPNPNFFPSSLVGFNHQHYNQSSFSNDSFQQKMVTIIEEYKSDAEKKLFEFEKNQAQTNNILNQLVAEIKDLKSSAKTIKKKMQKMVKQTNREIFPEAGVERRIVKQETLPKTNLVREEAKRK